MDAFLSKVAELLGALRAPHSMVALDVGSGRAKEYARRFPNRVAIDLQAKEGVDVVADAHHLPIRSSSIDVCLMVEVLEHLRDPSTAIGEASRVLRDGGVLVITTRSTYLYHGSPHDYYRYTKDSLLDLLGRAGLRPLLIREEGGVLLLLATIIHFTSLSRPKPIRGLLKLVAHILDLLDERTYAQRGWTTGYHCVAVKVAKALGHPRCRGRGGSGKDLSGG